MSAKTFSRDYAQGKVKKLQRMKQPLALKLILLASPPPGRPKAGDGPSGAAKTRSAERGAAQSIPPRNPVVYAMAHRAASAGAGKHIRSKGAMRRAEAVTLQRLVRQLPGRDD